MQLLLARCVELGARIAEPGEFTRRAFENDKLDLAQAEAVADLIDAATGKRSAQRGTPCRASSRRKSMPSSTNFTELGALTEATLDFPDEEIDFLESVDAFGRMGACASDWPMSSTAQQLGAPAAGRPARRACRPAECRKVEPAQSSGRGRSRHRDAGGGDHARRTKSSIQIEGIPLHVIDTAGLRETEDEVEKIGIARTWREIGAPMSHCC